MLVSFLVRVSLKFPGLLGLIPGPWRTDIFLIHLFRNLSWTVGKMVCCPQVELFSTFHSVAWNQFLDLAAYIQNRNLITDSFFFFFFLLVAFFQVYLFIYLFLAVSGLSVCARAFSSCGKRGPLFIAVRGPLTIAASLVVEHRLQTRRLSTCGSRA